MTTISLTMDAIEALRHGKTIKITHPDLGKAGYNGSIRLEPDDGAFTHVEVLDE